MTAEKPRAIHFNPRNAAWVYRDQGKRFASFGELEFLSAKKCRRMAHWLLRAAEWIEAGGKLVKGE